jgi:preprotein translocase subunit SecF
MSVTVVALIYNLDSILSFAIPMSVGTICGTFSSLFIAGPLYVFWCERDEKNNNKSNEEKQKNKKVAKYTNKIKGKGKKVQY